MELWRRRPFAVGVLGERIGMLCRAEELVMCDGGTGCMSVGKGCLECFLGEVWADVVLCIKVAKCAFEMDTCAGCPKVGAPSKWSHLPSWSLHNTEQANDLQSVQKLPSTLPYYS